MNDLRRELAPVTDDAWKEIEYEAQRTLKTYLAARKLVDFEGPLGWERSAVNRGRVRRLDPAPTAEVEARLRIVQPLVELRVPFELPRDELDDVTRGADDADLQAVTDAARKLAFAEDALVFSGYEAAGVTGIAPGSAHMPLALSEDYTQFPHLTTQAVEFVRESGIRGPYALALGPTPYNALLKTTAPGGFPILRHVERLVDGPIIWAPALVGAVLLSLRGGDFVLTVGRDISIGYLDHDSASVRLYLEESVTFRLLTPEAAIALDVAPA